MHQLDKFEEIDGGTNTRKKQKGVIKVQIIAENKSGSCGESSTSTSLKDMAERIG